MTRASLFSPLSSRSTSSWSISAVPAARAGFALSRSSPREHRSSWSNPRQFVWSVLATDADFGPDGALYFSDWVEGWEMTEQGTDLPRARPVAARRSAGPGSQDAAGRGDGEPVDRRAGRLLAHADMRVRQEAQFELAAPGRGRLARRSPGSPGPKEKTLPRIHADLGPGTGWPDKARRPSHQSVERSGPCSPIPIPRCVRRQPRWSATSREPKSFDAAGRPARRRQPASPLFRRDRAGQAGPSRSGRAACWSMLRANGDNDPYLRHAGCHGVGRLRQVRRLDEGGARSVAGGADGRPAGNAAAPKIPTIAGFLNDPDPRLVLEAARAINDVPITAALPGLAAFRLASSAPLPLLRRVLNANFRLGRARARRGSGRVRRARSDLPAGARVLALEMLAEWAQAVGPRRR